MARFLLFLILAAAFWWAYTTGIVDSITHEFKPKTGKKCCVVGPFSEDGVWLGETFDVAVRLIDSYIGLRSDQLAGAFARAAMKREGEAVVIANGTKVQVEETRSGFIHRVPFKVVKVKLINGKYAGAHGWVRRDDVIDTPLQELYQKFRSVSSRGEVGQSQDVTTQQE